MEEWARGQSAINPDAAGDAQQQALAKVAAAAGEVRGSGGRALLHPREPAAAGLRLRLCHPPPRVPFQPLPSKEQNTMHPIHYPPTHHPTHTHAPPPPQGRFLYTKFFAVGLFRLVELTGSKDPKSLAGLVKALGLVSATAGCCVVTGYCCFLVRWPAWSRPWAWRAPAVRPCSGGLLPALDSRLGTAACTHARMCCCSPAAGTASAVRAAWLRAARLPAGPPPPPPPPPSRLAHRARALPPSLAPRSPRSA